MGWLAEPISKTIKTKAFIEHQIKTELTAYELVKIVEGVNEGGYKPFFVALKTSEGKVFGVVFLTQRKNGNLAIKTISEDEGPFQLAPASFIELLSPTKSEFAQAWRERCVANG
jgi:hypothetical protein